jgi:general secretion pathway protein L
MRGFLSWWFAQLAGLLPDVVTRASARATDAAILDLGADAFNLLIRLRGTSTFVAQASADDAGLQELAQAIRAEKTAPSLLVLRPTRDHVLAKRLCFPLTARRDLKQLLGFEIDRETPFAREEVYWHYAVHRQDQAHGRLEVDLCLVPRRAVDPFIEGARRAGLAPSAIEVEASPGIMLVPLETDSPRFRAERPLIPLAAGAGALALIALAAPFVYQEWAIASANATIASFEDQAREAASLRQAADQLGRTINFLTKDGKRHTDALAILAAVTRSLPDDSYLTALSLRGTRLTMSGLSPAAAELVGLFAHSPLFREPGFDSPVVESENGDLESFTISVSLAQVRP